MPSSTVKVLGDKLPLSPEAALVLMLANGAMRFADSSDDEITSWLRILRLRGEGGRALQALGVGEQPLVEPEDVLPDPTPRGAPFGPRAIPAVMGHARTCAAAHGSDRVGTAELLMAVIHAYGEPFMETLRANGTSAREVLEQLAARRAAT